MRIAVPVLGEIFCEHFGRCDGFFLCDLIDGAIDRPRVIRRPKPRCESVPEWLKELGVKRVLVGGIGMVGRKNLNDVGVEVSTGHSGKDPLQIVKAHLTGKSPSRDRGGRPEPAEQRGSVGNGIRFSTGTLAMKRRIFILAGVCLLTAATSFWVTVAAKPSNPPPSATSPVLQWLGVSAGQRDEIQKDDPTFDAQSALLLGHLKEQRQALARLLEAPSTPDTVVLEQVDKTIAANAELERRVAQYVLRVRHHLTSQQQSKLMGLCASGLRGGGRGQGQGRAPCTLCACEKCACRRTPESSPSQK